MKNNTVFSSKQGKKQQAFMPFLCFFLLLSLTLLNSSGCTAQAQPDIARPQGWAQSIERAGLPNLYQVSDKLYRSAQPTEQGMHAAAKLGIHTVLSLRSGSDDAELVKNTGLAVQHVAMRAWNPNISDAATALRIIDQAPGPVLVHCYHGADRTGMVVALYRLVFQNWSREAAIQEMLEGGYGFHSMWGGIVTFLKTVDIDEVRAALRLPATQ